MTRLSDFAGSAASASGGLCSYSRAETGCYARMEGYILKVDYCPGRTADGDIPVGGCPTSGTVHHLCALAGVAPREIEAICIDCAILSGFTVPLRSRGISGPCFQSLLL